jgi:aryl-alcohol dehydrogenase-like predicted oxidoreductase
MRFTWHCPEATEHSAMQQRQFGNTGMLVSEIGLGCARVGGIFQRGPEGFVELLSAAHDHGINFFDTADMYSQGESEQLIGRTFCRCRSDVIIASKVGYELPAQRKLIARIKPLVRPLIRLLGIRRAKLPAAVSGEVRQNFEPGYIRKSVEASLRRLRTDYLDILQLHSPPAEIVRRGQWHRALEDLRRSGKVRYYGVSCDTLATARAALEFSGVASIQVVVSLLEQSIANAISAPAAQRGVAIIARECLANGLLVKSENEIDLKTYCDSPEREASRRLELAQHRRSAVERGIPLIRLALEYATGVEGVAVALIGASRTEQLTDALRQIMA